SLGVKGSRTDTPNAANPSSLIAGSLTAVKDAITKSPKRGEPQMAINSIPSEVLVNEKDVQTLADVIAYAQKEGNKYKVFLGPENSSSAKMANFALDKFGGISDDHRSEEHTSELQSRRDLVCR